VCPIVSRSPGVRVLAYSGDHDWQVPWTGTQYWTSRLGAKLGLLADWQPWYAAAGAEYYGSQVRDAVAGAACGSGEQRDVTGNCCDVLLG
jgi:Serine carboxypeptidase